MVQVARFSKAARFFPSYLFQGLWQATGASTTCSKCWSGPKALDVLGAALGSHAGSLSSPPAPTAGTNLYLPEL